jgi:hypothetical protein
MKFSLALVAAFAASANAFAPASVEVSVSDCFAWYLLDDYVTNSRDVSDRIPKYDFVMIIWK